MRIVSVLAVLLVWGRTPPLSLELATTTLITLVVLPIVGLVRVRAGNSCIVVLILSLGLTLGLTLGLALRLILGLALISLAGVVGNRTWDSLRGLIDIELLFDNLWDRLNLSSQLLLNQIKVETILPINQVNSQTQMTKPARTTNTMKIGLSVLREIKVDDDIDGLNIDTTSEEIRTDKVTTNAIPEVVENTVTVVLKHTGV